MLFGGSNNLESSFDFKTMSSGTRDFRYIAFAYFFTITFDTAFLQCIGNYNECG